MIGELTDKKDSGIDKPNDMGQELLINGTKKPKPDLLKFYFTNYQ